jgi:4-hydroxy-tetrahydrodipicolinate synthase
MINKIQNLQGSITAIVTPFLKDGDIDYVAYASLIDYQIQNNTDALVVCGTTGETPTLSEEEFRNMIRFTVQRVDGHIPVIAGCGSNSTEHSVHNARIAQEEGADGLLIVGPYYNKPTANGFYMHFAYIAENVGLPILIYNVPGRTGKNIPVSVILRLAEEYANIVGIKEASGDLNQIMDIINRRPAGFRVYSGDDALAYSVMGLGGDGCISVAANEIPGEFSKMIHCLLNGDYSSARALHYRYLNLMNLNFIESNPIPVKTALALAGKIQENFRLPMCAMESDTRAKLRAELINLGIITQ